MPVRSHPVAPYHRCPRLCLHHRFRNMTTSSLHSSNCHIRLDVPTTARIASHPVPTIAPLAGTSSYRTYRSTLLPILLNLPPLPYRPVSLVHHLLYLPLSLTYTILAYSLPYLPSSSTYRPIPPSQTQFKNPHTESQSYRRFSFPPEKKSHDIRPGLVCIRQAARGANAGRVQLPRGARRVRRVRGDRVRGRGRAADRGGAGGTQQGRDPAQPRAADGRRHRRRGRLPVRPARSVLRHPAGRRGGGGGGRSQEDPGPRRRGRLQLPHGERAGVAVPRGAAGCRVGDRGGGRGGGARAGVGPAGDCGVDLMLLRACLENQL